MATYAEIIAVIKPLQGGGRIVDLTHVDGLVSGRICRKAAATLHFVTANFQGRRN